MVRRRSKDKLGLQRHASPGRSHVGLGGNTHGDSDCRDEPNTEPLTRCDDTQAGHSRDATEWPQHLNPSTGLSRHS